MMAERDKVEICQLLVVPDKKDESKKIQFGIDLKEVDMECITVDPEGHTISSRKVPVKW